TCCQIRCHLDEHRGASGVWRTCGRGVSRLVRDRTRNAIRLSGFESQEEMSPLEVSSAKRIDHRETERQRPAGIDANQVVRSDPARVSLAKAEAADSNPKTMEEEREDRSESRFRIAKADLSQNVAQHGKPQIDVSALKELLGGAPLKLESL